MPVSPFSRRRFLRLCAGCFTLFPSATLLAKSAAAALRINVERGPWGGASASDISAVITSAAETIWENCTESQLRPIRVYRRGDFPFTDTSHDLFGGAVAVGLAAENARWAQFAFQFAHEFAHVLARHSEPARRAWRSLSHANMWLEECLGETASLFALRRMAESWRTQPPYPQWRDYAPALASYAAERLGRPEHQLPEGVSFPAWFRAKEPALRANPRLRAENVIIARELLPLFEQMPSGWEAMCFLNLGTHNAKKPLSQHASEWQGNSPAALRPFVGKIAAVFS